MLLIECVYEKVDLLVSNLDLYIRDNSQIISPGINRFLNLMKVDES